MSKLIFFIGPAGAGKTTLARAWASKHGGAFLDMDTLLRPAAAAIMTLAGKDPEDRDSPFYKQHCRDLGYRITMDAALENAALGLDAIVIGPFTREIGDPAWLGQELSRISSTSRLDHELSSSGAAAQLNQELSSSGVAAQLDHELPIIGSSAVEVKVVYVYLPSDDAYHARIRTRGSALDEWKLDNWEQFRPSLRRNEIQWKLDADSLLYFDNSGPYTPAKLEELEKFMDKAIDNRN